MPLFGSGFEAKKKLKPNLKMATQRISMIVNKKTNLVARHKREIVGLLQAGKYDKANIKIEHIIREDRTIEVYEIISLMCELLVERLTLIATDKVCPADLAASISTVIWVGPRLEVPELGVVTKQFGLKYGKDFVRRARQNADGFVDVRIMNRLSIQPPPREAREAYVKELCALGGIEFEESMLAGSTLAGVFSQDNRVGSKAEETPAGLPTFPAYNPAGAGGPGAPGAPGGTFPPGGPGAPGNVYDRPIGGVAMAAPGAAAAAAAAAAAPGMYRVGNPATGAAGPWVGAPAGGMPAGGMPAGGMPVGAAPAPVPSFPMPPTATAGEYGRAAFSAAMATGPGTFSASISAGGPVPAPTAGGLPAGINPAMAPTYAPPAPTGPVYGAKGAPTAGVAPGPAPAAGGAAAGAPGATAGVGAPRAPAQSTVPDFDELSARFAALRDA